MAMLNNQMVYIYIYTITWTSTLILDERLVKGVMLVILMENHFIASETMTFDGIWGEPSDWQFL